MKVRVSRRGLWVVDRFGSARCYRWRWLGLLVLAPLAFLACTAIALQRSINFLWILRHDPFRALRLYAAMNRTSAENMLGLRHPPTQSQLPTLELLVEKNTMQHLHEAKLTGDPRLGHDPGGDQPYAPAWFTDESGEVQKAKVAYRGAYDYHHWPEKPSLRIRIRKSDVALGRRYVELTRPKDTLGIRHQLPEYLARELGMVTTLNDPVRLFINKQYFGVYLRSYRPGEDLALAHDRMPGTFFKGDAVAELEHINLWAGRENWNVFGEAAEEDLAVFDTFLEALREPPGVESNARLAAVLNADTLAKWSAVMIVTGCIHTDAKHNQMYFLCSNQGKLEAVPWDPTCYEVAGRDFTPVNVVNNPVVDRMIRDPHWVHRRNGWIYALINGAGSAEALCRHVDEKFQRMLPDLRADPHLSKKSVRTGRWPTSVLELDDEFEEITRWCHAKERFLRDFLGDAKVAVEPDPAHAGHSLVHVFGNVAIRVSHAQGKPLTVLDQDREPCTLLHPGLSEAVHTMEFKPDTNSFELPQVVPTTLSYWIDTEPANLRFTNAVTGARVTPTNENRPGGRPRTYPPSAETVQPSGTVTLGPGVVAIEKDIHIGPRQTLTVQAGTRLRLGAGVGIYSQGPVRALGTQEAPITLEPLTDKPWGAFGVRGAASTGCEFRHVSVAGGSIGSHDGTRFKGMFNVYNCPNVVISHCRFGRNHVGDDAVNLAESTIRVEHCVFTGALFDAADLDMCRGSVTDCQWYDSGNDGLDLMTCRVRVERCSFQGSGDKGISVGENTRAIIRECTMRECIIGVELKDASRAWMSNCLLIGNRTGVHAYRKKWLYPRAGSALLADCVVREDRYASLDLEARSEVLLLRTRVGTVKRGESRVRQIEQVPDDWAGMTEELEP